MKAGRRRSNYLRSPLLPRQVLAEDFSLLVHRIAWVTAPRRARVVKAPAIRH